MFIAHLPAGYLCARLASNSANSRSVGQATLVFWGVLVGSVLPDLDMLYFYLVDNRQTNHHLYWTHIPFFWGVFLGTLMLIGRLARSRLVSVLSISILAGVMVHLLLDTPVGGIAWLYPFSAELLYLLEIPAVQHWWVLNFILHWTFLIEVTICLAALLVLVSDLKRQKHVTAEIASNTA